MKNYGDFQGDKCLSVESSNLFVNVVCWDANRTLSLFLREKLDSVNNDLSPLVKTPALGSELDKLQALLDSLTLVYKAKKGALDNSVNPTNAGQKQRDMRSFS